MIKINSRKKMKNTRHKRVRRKVVGNSSVPRLSVFKSLTNTYAQVIDDTAQATLCGCSTLTPQISEQVKSGKLNKTDAAKLVGEQLAALCSEKGITAVCFDRGGFPFTGRVKSLAEGAREKGLKF